MSLIFPFLPSRVDHYSRLFFFYFVLFLAFILFRAIFIIISCRYIQLSFFFHNCNSEKKKKEPRFLLCIFTLLFVKSTSPLNVLCICYQLPEISLAPSLLKLWITTTYLPLLFSLLLLLKFSVCLTHVMY